MKLPRRYCEERSDEAMQRVEALDCFATLAMTAQPDKAN
jgi:hypothetical protein